nr:uncharacterized protein LOC109160869 [Ipomoea batatas]
MLGHSSGGRSAALLYRRFVKLSFNPSGVASRVSTRRVFGYEVAGFGVCWCSLLIKLGVTLVWGSVSGAWWCGLGLYTYYISIATADVSNVLGLPNGPLPMSERDDQLVGPELRAWREEIKQRKGRITVKVLGTQLLELKDGENGSGVRTALRKHNGGAAFSRDMGWRYGTAKQHPSLWGSQFQEGGRGIETTARGISVVKGDRILLCLNSDEVPVSTTMTDESPPGVRLSDIEGGELTSLTSVVDASLLL